MAITLTGANKTITLDTAASFTAQSIYDAMVTWSLISTNMQFLIPMTASGKAPFGGGAYSDLVFSVVNGWKILTSGYSSTDIIKITGTMVCSTGDYADMIDSTSTGILIFNPASYGSVTTVSTGSGLSTEEHDAIMAIDTTVETNLDAKVSEVGGGTLTKEDIRAEMDANSLKLKSILSEVQ